MTTAPQLRSGRGPLVVADAGIPFGAELREDWYRLRRVEGDGWTASVLRDADAICVRSTTRVDAALLTGSGVRFVGTVTSGVDHLDLDFLRAFGVAVYHTPGANAVAVAEYVLANLVDLAPKPLPPDFSLGVIGVGNVGAAVARRAALLGISVRHYDPPRADAEDDFASVPLEAALEADAVTLHVPLARDGPHPTAELLDAEAIGRMRSGAILFNTARGGIVDEAAWRAAAEAGRLRAVVDCWLDEPKVNRGLLATSAVATPHLAGHTIDAKRRGARWIVRALDEFFAPPAAQQIKVIAGQASSAADVDGDTYLRLLAEQLDFEAVTLQMKALGRAPDAALATGFAALRANAGMRQELGRRFEGGWRRGTPVADPHLPSGPVRLL